MHKETEIEAAVDAATERETAREAAVDAATEKQKEGCGRCCLSRGQLLNNDAIHLEH